jgi:hypothetical protein
VPQVGNVHPNILKLKVNEMRVKMALHSIDVAFVNAFVDISSASGIPVVRRYLPLELGILPLASAKKSKAVVVVDVPGRPVSAVPATFPLHASSAMFHGGGNVSRGRQCFHAGRIQDLSTACRGQHPSRRVQRASALYRR